jgi:hypothetical protein
VGPDTTLEYLGVILDMSKNHQVNVVLQEYCSYSRLSNI